MGTVLRVYPEIQFCDEDVGWAVPTNPTMLWWAQPTLQFPDSLSARRLDSRLRGNDGMWRPGFNLRDHNLEFLKPLIGSKNTNAARRHIQKAGHEPVVTLY